MRIVVRVAFLATILTVGAALAAVLAGNVQAQTALTIVAPDTPPSVAHVISGTGTPSVGVDVDNGAGSVQTVTPNRMGDWQATFTSPSTPGSYAAVACQQDPASGRRLCETDAYAVVAPPTTTTMPPTTTAPPTTTLPTTTTTTVPPTTSTSTVTTVPATSTTSVAPPGTPTTTSTTSTTMAAYVMPGIEPPPPLPPVKFGVVTTTTSPVFEIPDGDWANLEVTAIEVTQGIQDLQNRMPLVEGRATWVRVYVRSSTEQWNPVTGVLEVTLDNEKTILEPANYAITARQDGGERTKLMDSLLFQLDPAWATGALTIRTFVWSTDPVTPFTHESTAQDNFRSVDVEFHPAEGLDLILVPLDPGASPGAPSANQMMQAASWMRTGILRWHPLADSTVYPLQQPIAPLDGETWTFDSSGGLEVLARLEWLHALWDLGDETKIVGIPHPNVSTGPIGQAWNSGVAWVKWQSYAGAGHEVGHLASLGHVGCRDADEDGIPDEGGLDQSHPTAFPNCSIAPTNTSGYYGLTTLGANPWVMDVFSNDRFTAEAGFPMMGYRGPAWIDAYHYCLLLEEYGVPCDPAAIGVPPVGEDAGGGPTGGGPVADCQKGVNPKDPDVTPPAGFQDFDLCIGVDDGSTYAVIPTDPSAWLLIGGSESDQWNAPVVVGSSHAAATSGATTRALVEACVATDCQPTHSLRIEDVGGGLLAHLPIVSQPAGHDETISSDAWLMTVPWPAEAARVTLMAGAQELATVASSATSPVVSSVDVAMADGGLTVTWSASDGDGDDLRFSVRHSRDDGQTWRPVVAGIAASSLRLSDVGVLPGGSAVFEVVATDGLRNGTAISDPVLLPNAAPAAGIVSPSDGTTVFAGQAVRFSGWVHDPEEGAIRDMMWVSDLDGRLGSGSSVFAEDLSPGDHTIVLSFRDDGGAEASATTRVRVLPAPVEPIDDATLDAVSEILDGRTPAEGDATEASTPVVTADPSSGPTRGAVGAIAAVTLIGGLAAYWTWRRRSAHV